MKEIAVCSRHYMDNRCDPATRIPAMQETCSMWERCMRRDPSVVARCARRSTAAACRLRALTAALQRADIGRDHRRHSQQLH